MRRLGRFIWLIITMVLVAVAIAFATSNVMVITLYLWPFNGTLTAPIWLVVISSFIIGGLLSICLMSAQTLAIRARFWNLQVKFNRLEAEMNQRQSVVRKHHDRTDNGVSTPNYAPTPNIEKENQGAKTFLTD